MLNDLVGGHIQAGVSAPQSSGPHVHAGRLRMLALMSAERSSAFPDVPTMREQGFPELEVETWYGVFAPAGTPKAIVNRLHADIVKAMQTPEVKAKLEGIGADGSVSRSPQEYAALVKADAERYARVIKDIGLKID
jgi:tripartite-type tricarboxylate transporter receptor subunit TctC